MIMMTMMMMMMVTILMMMIIVMIVVVMMSSKAHRRNIDIKIQLLYNNISSKPKYSLLLPIEKPHIHKQAWVKYNRCMSNKMYSF